MIIKFENLGKSLGTRFLGAEIREKVEANIENGEKIIFDLENVDLVSNSFADECFGKLIIKFNIETIKKNTSFINVNSLNEKIILKAINDRIKLI
ncbi:STAS-like domain-containing protein [Clostridium tertium]|uniref:STAS-like domain-containing protein n=1 Tax=Clostridium tertium TaxID=1559 RepID=UPI002028E819|nr:STAS-like domain-containing protein [Clostridium tertium]